MNNEIRFSLKQGNIEAAARFIVGNNIYMHNKTVDYFVEDIKATINRMIDKIRNGGSAWYTATAGYAVVAIQEDENYYVIEVLVDPSVSSDAEFVYVENIV